MSQAVSSKCFDVLTAGSQQHSAVVGLSELLAACTVMLSCSSYIFMSTSNRVAS
jgi:hypothetical protein